MVLSCSKAKENNSLCTKCSLGTKPHISPKSHCISLTSLSTTATSVTQIYVLSYLLLYLSFFAMHPKAFYKMKFNFN